MTPTTTMTRGQRAAAKWRRIKPIAWALVIGLITGPIISNIAGWQTLSSTAKSRLDEGLIQQQATFCDVQARAEVPEPGKLDWSARNKLAERFALMPGLTQASADVVNACARKLGA
jgi:hypothetical protein